MEDLLNTIWLQAGFAGLLAISGWIAWWFQRKETIRERDKNHELFSEVIVLMTEHRGILEDIQNSLSAKDVIIGETDKIFQKLEKLAEKSN